jgi:hypothetical protein
MFDCFPKKYKPPLAQNFVKFCRTLFHKSPSKFEISQLVPVPNFSSIKIDFFLWASYMLFEVTIVIKLIFVRCYTFKKQGCNIEHSKNNNKTGSRRCSCPMSDACQQGFGSGSALIWTAGSGSAYKLRIRIQEGKMTQKNWKKDRIFILCWMFSFENWRLLL